MRLVDIDDPQRYGKKCDGKNHRHKPTPQTNFSISRKHEYLLEKRKKDKSDDNEQTIYYYNYIPKTVKSQYFDILAVLIHFFVYVKMSTNFSCVILNLLTVLNTAGINIDN